MARKQLEIAGTERKRIKEVDDAMESYVDARDERMALTEKEVDALAALATVMKKHKLNVYRDDNADPPLVVEVTPGEDKIKVKRVKVKEESDEG
jgi:hypothetical protein